MKNTKTTNNILAFYKKHNLPFLSYPVIFYSSIIYYSNPLNALRIYKPAFSYVALHNVATHFASHLDNGSDNLVESHSTSLPFKSISNIKDRQSFNYYNFIHSKNALVNMDNNINYKFYFKSKYPNAIVIYDRNLQLILFYNKGKWFLLLNAKEFLIKSRFAIINYVKNNWKACLSIYFISFSFKPFIKHCFDCFGFGPLNLFPAFGLLYALFCLLRSGFKNIDHNFSIKWFIFNFVVGSIMAYLFNKLGSLLDPVLFCLFLNLCAKFI